MPRHNRHNLRPPSAKRKKRKKRGPEDGTRNALVRRKLLLGVSVGRADGIQNEIDETALEKAERLGCVHPHYLSFAGKCDGCRRLPLSGRNYPDHYNRASRRSDEDSI